MAGGMVPVPTPETAEFWAGTLAGELRMQQCGDCQRFYFYPRSFCRYCSSTNVHWRTLSGDGRLVSYVINHRPFGADNDDPQVIALVQLDEGPTMLTNIIDVEPDPAKLPLDARVRVTFEDRGDQALAVFTLAGQS